jgi:hypothetical protein
MASREYMQKEIQTLFLDHIRSNVNYWNRQTDRDSLGKLNGLAFSILAMLDGCSCGIPAFEIIPVSHPKDKDFQIASGENYFPEFRLPKEVVTVHGGAMLHELFYTERTTG